jgi:hypothetical protein
MFLKKRDGGKQELMYDIDRLLYTLHYNNELIHVILIWWRIYKAVR